MAKGVELAVGYVSIVPETSQVAPGVEAALQQSTAVFEKFGMTIGQQLAKGITSGFAQVQGQAKSVGTSTGSEIAKGASDSLKKTDIFKPVVAQASKAGEQVTKHLTDAGKKATAEIGKQAEKTLGSATESFKLSAEAVTKAVAGLDSEARKKLEEIGSHYNKLNETLKKTGETAERVKKKINSVEDSASKGWTQQLHDEYDKLIAQQERLEKKSKRTVDSMRVDYQQYTRIVEEGSRKVGASVTKAIESAVSDSGGKLKSKAKQTGESAATGFYDGFSTRSEKVGATIGAVIGKPLGMVTGKVKEVGEKAGAGLKDAAIELKDKLTGVVGSGLLKGIGVGTLVAGGLGLADLIGTTFSEGAKRNQAIEQVRQDLMKKGYNYSQTEAVIDNVNQAIKKSPAPIDKALESASIALGSGVQQGKDLKNYLSLIVDLSIKSKKSFSDLSAVFDEMISKPVDGENEQAKAAQEKVDRQAQQAERAQQKADRAQQNLDQQKADLAGLKANASVAQRMRAESEITNAETALKNARVDVQNELDDLAKAQADLLKVTPDRIQQAIEKFTNMDIPIKRWLQDSLKVTEDALNGMLSRGEVKLADFQKAISDHIGAGVRNGARSVEDLGASLKNSLAKLGGDIINVFTPRSEPGADNPISNIISKIIDGIDRVDKYIVDNRDKIRQVISNIVEWGITAAETLIKLGAQLNDIVTGMVTKYIDAMTTAVDAFGGPIGNFVLNRLGIDPAKLKEVSALLKKNKDNVNEGLFGEDGKPDETGGLFGFFEKARDMNKGLWDDLKSSDELARSVRAEVQYIDGQVYLSDNSQEVIDNIDKTQFEIQNIDGRIKLIPLTPEASRLIEQFKIDQEKESERDPLKLTVGADTTVAETEIARFSRKVEEIKLQISVGAELSYFEQQIANLMGMPMQVKIGGVMYQGAPGSDSPIAPWGTMPSVGPIPGQAGGGAAPAEVPAFAPWDTGGIGPGPGQGVGRNAIPPSGVGPLIGNAGSATSASGKGNKLIGSGPGLGVAGSASLNIPFSVGRSVSGGLPVSAQALPPRPSGQTPYPGAKGAVYRAMIDSGFPPSAFQMLDYIVMNESQYRPGITNPVTGDWGIPQFNPAAGNIERYLPSRSLDPYVQGIAMMRYINDRYGPGGVYHGYNGAKTTMESAYNFKKANTWYAGGGSVAGPGGKTSDVIPAMLSDGEHVLTADDVAAMGGQQAVYRFRKGLHAFAVGGAVEEEQRKRLLELGMDPNTSDHGMSGGAAPGPTDQQLADQGVDPAQPFLAPDRKDPVGRQEGFKPVAAGNTGVAGTSFAASLLNMGAEAINGVIDQAASAASTAAALGMAAGSMGAGAAASPAAGQAAQFAIGMGTNIAKRGVSYGFQLLSILTDAAIAQLFPFGAPRLLGYDYTAFIPQIPGQEAATTTGEKADAYDQGRQNPEGSANPAVSVAPRAAQPGDTPNVQVPGMAPGKPPGPDALWQPRASATANKPLAAEAGGRPSMNPDPNNAPNLMMTRPELFQYDNGGWLMPGQAGINLTRQPEPVLNPQQWQAMRESVQPARGSNDYSIRIDNLQVKDVEELQRELDSRQKLQMMRYAGRP